MGATSTQKRDADGEALLLQLVETLRGSGQRFTDPLFPPDDSSLYRDQPAASAGGEQSVRMDLAPFLSAVKGVEWKRAAEIGGSDLSVVFSDDIDPDDIAQGNLGDCYFLAALASCASAKNDVLLNDLIIEEGHDVGLYGVKFFVNG